jgi:predicted amidohydrolase
MSRLKVALAQLTSTADRAASTAVACRLIGEAAKAGAQFVLTPEVTTFMGLDREAALAYAVTEDADPSIPEVRDAAARHGVWVLLGSAALKDEATGKLVNRSFLINDQGAIVARYDKIHLFDVDLGEGRSFRESDTYRPGDAAVVAATPWGKIGLTICYDIRFPYLYRAYGQAGVNFITVPAAFTPWTGAAHWHVLLRARAIETGAFVLAPAQTGDHGKGRQTYGHSLVVAPWGEVLADGGEPVGLTIADLDLDLVQQARAKVPAWGRDQKFTINSLT